jgi:outer membrane protein OmpA-like peptidoglycan-associated protein
MFTAQNHKAAKTPTPEAVSRGKSETDRGGPVRVNPLWLQLATRVPVQAKLGVSQPDDPYEQEADRVADRVMRMAEPGPMGSASAAIQRKCAECEHEEDEKEKTIQTWRTTSEQTDGGLDQGAAARAAEHGGSPLSKELRSYFEPRFSYDFSGVRVHSDGESASAAQAVQARAYTIGRDIVFGAGQYAPATVEGKRLVAHELTHVVQQGAPAVWPQDLKSTVPEAAVRGNYSPKPVHVAQSDVSRRLILRQAAACPIRPPDEAARSRAPGGILPTDVVTPSTNMVALQDFPVNDAALPSGATADPVFQRFMSIAAGDPSAAVAVKGYTDCVGVAAENLSLRDRRAQAVVAAMPSALQSRPRFSWPTSPTTDFRDTNTTPEGRARNRAVEVTFSSVPPVAGQDPCDVPARAADMDQYMFLVRCAERRLSLTTAADAPTMVSALRQIYYGAAAWSASRNPVWNFVITNRPWSPGTNPATQLGTHLFTALRDSQVVAGHDMGHLLTGLDAMLNPHEVEITAGSRIQVVLPTGLANEEWATWAGDVGSAAAEFAVGLYTNPSTDPIGVYFANFANSRDLLGNLDSFAIRAGLTGLAPASQLQHAVTLSGTFSELLMQYFRITSSTLSRSRTSAARNFIEAYGGLLSGNTLTNRPTLEAALRPSVENFAGRFVLFLMLQRGLLNTPPATPGPQPTATLPSAVTDATRLYVDFLLANL